jgi:hypothetical protein
MNLRRTFDYFDMFDVMYHPDVEPYVSLGQKIPDLEPLIGNPLNVCLVTKFGGFLFVKHPGENVYDVHTAFIPEGRGPHLVELAKQAREFMFFQANAEVLRTFVSHDNKPARRLALAAGFKDSEDMELFGILGKLMTMERKDVCQ